MSYDVNKLTKLGHLKSLATNLKAAIPTKVSQLTNDAQYQTNAQVAPAMPTSRRWTPFPRLPPHRTTCCTSC